MSTITKKELIDRIAQSTQAKQSLVKATVQSFLDEIIGELARGNRLEFRDFGVFETKTRAPRTAQNPKTLEKIQGNRSVTGGWLGFSCCDVTGTFSGIFSI